MKGIGVSPGISIGKACIIKKKEAVLTGITLQGEEEIAIEILRFEQAVAQAILEIETIKANETLNLGEEDIAILETQIEFLGDPQIKEDMLDLITGNRKNANDALIAVIASMVELFESLDDEYMRARAADIQDIGNRISKHLHPNGNSALQKFEADSIIIAEDIAPSDTITMDIKQVIGFATQAGSKTSHAAIIAKSKGIPAIVGCGESLKAILDNDTIIMDGQTGLIYVNPDQELLEEYIAKRTAYQVKHESLKALKDLPSQTSDGERVTLLANISGAEDMEEVFEHGGEGAGLLRTELLFMNRNSFPSEEEQFEFYKQAAIKARGKEVIVRTIDIGGDKNLPYFNLPAELNPFLGYRAIRICLDQKDIFITQLKAILRAAPYGDLKIMFPMISNIQEIRAAKAVLEEAKAELKVQGVPFSEIIKVGIMIEIPSAAITADLLAKEVDFFSIGTNDLCQYTLAVDRMNEKITHLYDPFNPGVLRLIQFVIKAGHEHQIPVAMCGEMASDPMATLLLIGMGLKEFSMSAAAIPAIKNIIIRNSLSKAKEIYAEIKQMDSSADIISYLAHQHYD